MHSTSTNTRTHVSEFYPRPPPSPPIPHAVGRMFESVGVWTGVGVLPGMVPLQRTRIASILAFNAVKNCIFTGSRIDPGPSLGTYTLTITKVPRSTSMHRPSVSNDGMLNGDASAQTASPVRTMVQTPFKPFCHYDESSECVHVSKRRVHTQFNPFWEGAIIPVWICSEQKMREGERGSGGA